jgi:hypothetical protein
MSYDYNIRVVLGSLRYKSAPDTNLMFEVPLIQTSKEIIEFERSIDVGLEQVYDDERQRSDIFRPVGKFMVLFSNNLAGSSIYNPFENNLYYINPEIAADLECGIDASPVAWTGLPQYNEFDFIRTDYDVTGYTQPPNEHILFAPQSASSYNWNFFISYPYENDYDKPMQIQFKEDPTNPLYYSSGDGIPYIIENTIQNGSSIISLKCGVKHGVNLGEFVILKDSVGNIVTYRDQSLFQVYSLGLETYESNEYVINLFNIGYTGTTFNNLNKGTLKRVILDSNSADTISKYYVRKHKILTEVNDTVLVKAGFEQNIFGIKKKYESSGLTPNKIARVSVKEGGQSYTLSFNKDIEINRLKDNQTRPITELFFTVIWKGFFGWTTGRLQQGWEFNLPLISGLPSDWWKNINNSADCPFVTGSYCTMAQSTQGLPSGPPFLFNYVEPLMKDDVLDGDFCEWNDYEQLERVISDSYHKFKFNRQWFNVLVPSQIPPVSFYLNPYGYYYKPHHSITLRVYSDYIENGTPGEIVGIPDYSYYSSTNNQFIWRDIYSYGFVDGRNLGVNYPFLNGTHYPFKNIIFRIIPEGTNYIEQTIIPDPLIDFCE